MAVRILRIGQQFSPPPFLVSGYGPVHVNDRNRPTGWLIVQPDH